MKAVQVVDRTVSPSQSFPRSTTVAGHRLGREASNTMPTHLDHEASCEPLFLPESSQLSTAHEQAIRSSGLGIEIMNADELAQMLDGEGEEVAYDFSLQKSPNEAHQNPQGHEEGETDHLDSFDLQIEEGGFEPTQVSDSSKESPPLSSPLQRLTALTPYIDVPAPVQGLMMIPIL
jgi:cell cycle checkpoint control protein RAD9A